MKDVMVVVGTRPEIIKMAPLIKALKMAGIQTTFVHCGQHYDFAMSEQFIADLELSPPDYAFRLRSISQGIQTARIIISMEQLLKQTLPSLVLVEGDTNTVLATALAAVKLGIPVGHVEAGLRSWDLRMPEEHNRRLTDHISKFLFAPTQIAKKNLEKENVWGSVYITGNTVIDSVIQHLPIALRKSRILNSIRFGKFALVTAHRAENVDNSKVLRNFVDTFLESPIPLVFPIHPRTKKMLIRKRILNKLEKSGNVQILPPLGYLDFLVLLKNCEAILTDSGGIQEEATAPVLRKPTLVIRLSTERPEAVAAGFATVVGTDKNAILAAFRKVLDGQVDLPIVSPYGNGDASQRIVEIIRREHCLS